MVRLTALVCAHNQETQLSHCLRKLSFCDQIVVVDGVSIVGYTNLAARKPYDASQLYARNVLALVQHLVRPVAGPDGQPTGGPMLVIDEDDEITREILVTNNGAIVHPKVRPAEKAH